LTHSNIRAPGFSSAQSLPLTRAWRWLLVLCLLSMVGCAQPLKPREGEENFWSGRLAMQVEDQASQSFSALFELRGDTQNGGLVLISPLGSRLAQLDWQDGHAQLATGAQEVRTSDSLENLLQDVTGARIPIAALFSWLQGTQATAPGWEADLSGLAEGRLIARRDNPAPKATLRIALTK
jgi:outer membrane lipoprotein LolB